MRDVRASGTRLAGSRNLRNLEILELLLLTSVRWPSELAGLGIIVLAGARLWPGRCASATMLVQDRGYGLAKLPCFPARTSQGPAD